MSSNFQILNDLIDKRSAGYQQKVTNVVSSVPDQILQIIDENTVESVNATTYTALPSTITISGLTVGKTYEIISNVNLESNVVNNYNALRLMNVTDSVELASNSVLFWLSEELNYDVTNTVQITASSTEIELGLEILVQVTATLTKNSWQIIVKSIN